MWIVLTILFRVPCCVLKNTRMRPSLETKYFALFVSLSLGFFSPCLCFSLLALEVENKTISTNLVATLTSARPFSCPLSPFANFVGIESEKLGESNLFYSD